MAKNPWKVVEEIIRNSDLLLNILDARFPDKTMNSVIEGKIRTAGKTFFYVLNKSDLVNMTKTKSSIQMLKARAPVIAFSAKDRTGKGKLMDFLKRFAKESKQAIRVGIVGYPNVGKSAIINALTGRRAAPTSPVAGYTKGKRWVKLTENILLVDTPGVIPNKEKSEIELIMKDAMTQIEDPEGVAEELLERLIKKNKRAIEEFYNVEIREDVHDTLTAIAISKSKLKKGGVPDLAGAGKLVIEDWQRGKLVI